MTKKKDSLPPQLQFYYGDGETVDPMTRERHVAPRKVETPEDRPATPADGLDR